MKVNSISGLLASILTALGVQTFVAPVTEFTPTTQVAMAQDDPCDPPSACKTTCVNNHTPGFFTAVDYQIELITQATCQCDGCPSGVPAGCQSLIDTYKQQIENLKNNIRNSPFGYCTCCSLHCSGEDASECFETVDMVYYGLLNELVAAFYGAFNGCCESYSILEEVTNFSISGPSVDPMTTSPKAWEVWEKAADVRSQEGGSSAGSDLTIQTSGLKTAA